MSFGTEIRGGELRDPLHFLRSLDDFSNDNAREWKDS